MQFDSCLITIADYVYQTPSFSDATFKTAKQALLDSFACAFLGLQQSDCQARLGAVIPGTQTPKGAQVFGTDYYLDPMKAACDMSTCIRWLDFNDTWLAAEWAHPSDNLGGILATADYCDLNVQAVLTAMIQAYEIQGVLALDNAFNRVGLDHVILVKLATVAVCSYLLGNDYQQTLNALSLVFVDGQSLRTYRQAPNVGVRKSWAAGDATARGLWLAWLARAGEMGYPSALSAAHWGFEAVYFEGKPITLARALNNYVMDHILFKVAFPAEFHGQTAVECAIQLHPQIKDQLDNIERIEIITQAPAMQIIDKTGSLHHFAERDHALQYMVAIGLIYGKLTAKHYSDEIAQDPRIDRLREKMHVQKSEQFTQDYYDPEKRSIANRLQIFFNNETKTDPITIEYPLGHPQRRQEAEPFLKAKYTQAVCGYYAPEQAELLIALWSEDRARFQNRTVRDLMQLASRSLS